MGQPPLGERGYHHFLYADRGGATCLAIDHHREVAANYYQLCALDQELSIVQQTLDARREGVRLAKLRYEADLLPRRLTTKPKWSLARTETLIPSLERQIKIKESDLSMLLGEYTDDIPVPLLERSASTGSLCRSAYLPLCWNAGRICVKRSLSSGRERSGGRGANGLIPEDPFDKQLRLRE